MWSTGHSTSCEPMSWPNSKRSGREPGSSTGRPIQERLLGGVEAAPRGRRSRRAACRSPGGPSATRAAASTASTLKASIAAARGADARRPSPRAGCDGRWRAPSASGISRAARRRPVDVVDRLVLAQRPVRLPCFEEVAAAPPRSGIPASRAGATRRRRRRHWPRWRRSASGSPPASRAGSRT